ncbi:uncharacterized protein FIBRA_06899 [Fibroporia radiculosa]|uniref:Heterokaryon incompatibility domain-containing protein n=1 Tax=Fibroporia radiculosa TaxID=599839 RepID=J4HZU0_9APHY|nr:uncharacterized protein FIBRA_06899 [Fibroporia radiculosa]CCM04712.1 predicted protein [Fibroporia radiculosa]
MSNCLPAKSHNDEIYIMPGGWQDGHGTGVDVYSDPPPFATQPVPWVTLNLEEKVEQDVPSSAGSNLSTQVVHRLLDEYIINELPIFLIYLPEMALVHRSAIKKQLEPTGWIDELIQQHQEMSDSLPSPMLVGHVEDGVPSYVEYMIMSEIKEKLRYAIFSHRWLPEGEPSFQDFASGSIMEGNIRRLWNGIAASGDVPLALVYRRLRESMPRAQAGYSKLLMFCEVARRRGCGWAWSDTCCINKTSSAELEESIRSMFSWYRKAHVCIVYLKDTTNEELELEQDEWFTRGWTLQELLAPECSKFYNGVWEPMTGQDNDKEYEFDHEEGCKAGAGASFLRRVSSITGIPVSTITDFKPGLQDVRGMMVWASKRHTTRIEDMAYSLIGLLDVDLRISYGEGKRAFYRLQVAILENCAEFGLLVWSGGASAYNSAIAAGPECFCPVAWGPLSPVYSGVQKSSGVELSSAFTNYGLRLPLSVYDGRKQRQDTDTMWLDVEELGLVETKTKYENPLIDVRVAIVQNNAEHHPGDLVVAILLLPYGTGGVYNVFPTTEPVVVPRPVELKPLETVYIR